MIQENSPDVAAPKSAPRRTPSRAAVVVALSLWCGALGCYYLAHRSDCFSSALFLVASVLLFALPALICAGVAIYQRPRTVVVLALIATPLWFATQYAAESISKCYCGCGYPG